MVFNTVISLVVFIIGGFIGGFLETVNETYTLAEMLIEQGRYPEAMSKAKMCLKFQPQFQPARKLVMDLSVMKETFQTDGKEKW